MEDLLKLIDQVKNGNIAEEAVEEVETQPDKHPISAHIELIEEKKVARRLGFIYENIPQNNCERCAKCCFNGPQVHFIEFLNIVRALDELPQEKKDEIAKNIIEYEMLNLTSLDYDCPFLFEGNCAIYEVRPLQCRLFAFYPEPDYEANRIKSKQANQELMKMFCMEHSIKLPDDVLSHDVDQCGNNLGPDGKPVVFNEYERILLVERIKDLEASVIPYELDPGEEYTSFSHLFMFLYFEYQDFAQDKIIGLKEKLNKDKSEFVEEILRTITFPVIK